MYRFCAVCGIGTCTQTATDGKGEGCFTTEHAESTEDGGRGHRAAPDAERPTNVGHLTPSRLLK